LANLAVFAVLALLAVSVGVSPDAPEASASPPDIDGTGSLGVAPVHERVGLVDPSTGIWYLRSDDGAVSFYYGNPGDYPMMGDWDCDGIATPGLYRQSDGFAYLRNTNSQGNADIRFFFGNPSDVPLAGDFNGDGCDTVSIYRQTEGRVYIINKLGENDGGLGVAEYSFFFGNPGDKPFVGDFDGDGIDTVGLHRESTGFVYFRDSNSQGNAEFQFFFGDPGDRLVAGDWNGNGSASPAVYRPSDITFYFRHSNTQGNADTTSTWGRSGWLPVARVPHLTGGDPLPGPLYPGPNWPTSLAGVAFADGVPADLRPALVSDGFAINASASRPHMAWIYDGVYPYGGKPVFVTTDAAYHHWHLVFDKVLRDTEQNSLLPELESLLTSAVAAARAQTVELSATALADDALRVEEYFEAAATVAGLSVGPIGTRAQAEVALIEAATDIAVSPTAGGTCPPACVDYSLMKPRGHYTRNADLQRYFKAMAMLGNVAFPIGETDVLRVGLLASRVLTADPTLTSRWTAVYEPTAFIVGAADDYTPPEAADAATAVVPGGLSTPTALASDATVDAIGAKLLATRPVQIDPQSASLRTMGVRFVLDSWVYDQLSHPNVVGRGTVSPLDFAAVMSSDWALARQVEAGVSSTYPDYGAAVASLRTEVAGRDPAAWSATVYDAWLDSLTPLWKPHGDAFPPYQRSNAWAAKSHQTGFGSYTELKHDTILYAKQGIAEGDMEPPPVVRHAVEAEPEAFHRVAEMARLLRDELSSRNLLPGSSDDLWTNRGLLEYLITTVERLASIAEDELAARPISTSDIDFLDGIGSRFGTILEIAGDFELDRYDAVVADIFLGGNDQVLEVAAGRFDQIHVIVPDGRGGFEVATGAVYSYYEFWQPRTQRLTDDEWWDMLDAGTEPPRPWWVRDGLGL
jgi:hypothetical protein